MQKTIYFIGSLPKNGQAPFGGGEVGNVRTIKMLRKGGYKVITMRQRKADAGWGRMRVLLTYPFRMIVGWMNVFLKMAFASRQAIAHLSGFAGKTIFNEYIVMCLMKIMGFRVVYELRGGGAINFWHNGSSCYRNMFSFLLKRSSYVFVQGEENIPLVKQLCDTPVYHYANCVEDGFAPISLPKKPNDRINLLFYGRCEENKHVDMIVEIADFVQKSIPNVHLTIVGNGQQSYVEMVKSKMVGLLRPDTFIYQQGFKHDELPSLLMDKHFYIFPSTQPREGQSNSVTECMSFGIIPIASPQGFNRSTIGNDNLIVDELSADAYARRIIDIIRNGEINKYSEYVRERFLNNFTQRVVFEKTLREYEKAYSINN